MRCKKAFLNLSLLLFVILFAGFKWLTINSDLTAHQSSTLPQAAAYDHSNDNIDPKAVEILRNSLNYFSNVKEFSAQAQSTLEDILDSGHRVDYEFAGEVVVQRPNHFRNERFGKKMHQIFYFDGKTLTLYNPDQKVYATEPSPGTIDDMFHVARDSFGISVPISDLVYSNSFQLLYQNVNYAVVIGKEMIGDVQCDHLLFSRDEADFQIWIADSAPLLPYRYVVTDKTTPELLSFSTTIYNWNLNPEIPENYFDFIPPKGTQKIIFLNPNVEN